MGILFPGQIVNWVGEIVAVEAGGAGSAEVIVGRRFQAENGGLRAVGA